MKPEAKSKVRRRHSEAIGAFIAWLDQFPKDKVPSLEVQTKKFDRLVDAHSPEEADKKKKRLSKVEHTTST